MKTIARFLSLAALICTLAVPLLFFSGRLSLPQCQVALLAATFAWFTSAPLWMEHSVRE